LLEPPRNLTSPENELPSVNADPIRRLAASLTSKMAEGLPEIRPTFELGRQLNEV